MPDGKSLKYRVLGQNVIRYKWMRDKKPGVCYKCNDVNVLLHESGDEMLDIIRCSLIYMFAGILGRADHA